MDMRSTAAQALWQNLIGLVEGQQGSNIRRGCGRGGNTNRGAWGDILTGDLRRRLEAL